ncbi:Uncharacterised protein [Mycobacteroides abscessus subsp. abscessus]|nr:Uncharacterised protein [Mycobacteroides abscessus subsp. abscessus]
MPDVAKRSTPPASPVLPAVVRVNSSVCRRSESPRSAYSALTASCNDGGPHRKVCASACQGATACSCSALKCCPRW